MDKELLIKKAYDVVSPIISSLGYEVVEIEYVFEGRNIFRIYVDSESGVNIDDCERVSRAIEDVIEVEELVPSSYFLEVSSPGIDRPIRKREDFLKFSGSTVKVKTSRPIDGRSNFKGVLKGMEGDDILIIVDGTEFKVPHDALSKARIETDEDLFKRQIKN